MCLVEPTTPSEARSLVLCSGTVQVSLPASQKDTGFLMLHVLQSVPRELRRPWAKACVPGVSSLSLCFFPFCPERLERFGHSLGQGHPEEIRHGRVVARTTLVLSPRPLSPPLFPFYPKAYFLPEPVPLLGCIDIPTFFLF